MGNFERLSVLVIVVVIVMILIVALVQLTNDPADASGGKETAAASSAPGALTNPATPPLAPPTGVPLKATPPTVGPVGPPPPPSSNDGLRVQGDALKHLLEGGGSTTTTSAEGPAAPPVATAETQKPAEPRIHVVQPGETFQKIARQYYPNAVARATDAIVKANPNVDASRMRVGTKLTIPVLEVTTPAGTSSTAIADAQPAPRTSTGSGGVSPGATYTVRSGDTLASIARRAYGSSNRWHEIWIENFDAVGDEVDHPRAGTRLKIPR